MPTPRRKEDGSIVSHSFTFVYNKMTEFDDEIRLVFVGRACFFRAEAWLYGAKVEWVSLERLDINHQIIP
jgi:hypothetical protein